MSEIKDNETTMTTENKQCIEIENQCYRLGEMAEAMEQSIANAQRVANEQNTLIEIIANSDKAEDFNAFIEQCKQQVENINSQISILKIRSVMLKQVVDACNENEDTAKLISVLIKALGVFEQQK